MFFPDYKIFLTSPFNFVLWFLYKFTQKNVNLLKTEPTFFPVPIQFIDL